MAAPLDQLNELLLAASTMDTGFRGRVRCEPLALERPIFSGFQRRHAAIKRFQQTVVDLCHASLSGDLDPHISKLLLNEIPACYGEEYHRQVLSHRRDTPLFFRTDETIPGKISEIQCPGSGWGECALLTDYYEAEGHRSLPPLASAFARDVRLLFTKSEAKVLYLLDNCALPNTTTYFIHQTRRHGLRYYPFDRGLRPPDANLIRSHTFLGLVSECNFAERLRQYYDGALCFDYPPTMLFDQKMPLTLPFLSATRAHFDDEIRDLFPHASLLVPEGVTFAHGMVETIAQFARRTRETRDYYLKYASHDIPLHLPGRGVYWLGGMSAAECEAVLAEAAAGGVAGKHWLIQEGARERGSARYFDADGSIREGVFDTKYSAYYGPSGLLCIDVMHDEGAILRQSASTVIGVCMAVTGGP